MRPSRTWPTREAPVARVPASSRNALACRKLRCDRAGEKESGSNLSRVWPVQGAMKKELSDAALVCAFALSFGATHAAPQVPQGLTRLDSVQVAAWREDLAFMAREMERRHRNLYHTVS